MRFGLFVAGAVVALATCTPADDKQPVADEPAKKLDPAHVKALAEAVGAKAGETHGKVHTITLPRADLDVSNLELGEIPIEAGLASTFHVWRCSCGKYYVLGQFCVIDYESNDVIDALRANNTMSVVSIAPMLLQERPKILLIRFQGEGDIDAITKNLKEAMRWMGEARTKPNPVKNE
jgi:hypothetical protein